MMADKRCDREALATAYFDELPYDPYPVQEEALLAWFTAEQGVLVCTPTGTGKTLIAEAAVFEALHSGKRAYYTTPLIALTEQKFHELQVRAASWGFSQTDIGLVTGNRRENPDARILVVVAEILLNRLLSRERFDFSQVDAVVMDEFHNFADPERGIVWELSLGLLPRHVRTLLLSATVGNAVEFQMWLRRCHDRYLELVQSDQRRVPLRFSWVGDRLLDELLVDMAQGDEDHRKTPALVFCFNREECWTVAEQLKGKKLLDEGRQMLLQQELKKYDWTEGAGPKLRQILLRGVGVHHAGVLPKYRRIVEDLFEQKLLTVTVCTETLAAGINLPARSVVLPTLVKGPPDKKKLIDASAAHQMFGRAGRPQFDVLGHVFALAHEDDVKLLRWRERYDQIPDDAKDPGLRRAKRALKKKMPKRRTNVQYWTAQQFDLLRTSPPAKLFSKGTLPWRLLAHVLEISPNVEILRALVSKRLMDSGRLVSSQQQLDAMLLTLWRAGYVELVPPPPASTAPSERAVDERAAEGRGSESTLFGMVLGDNRPFQAPGGGALAEPQPPADSLRYQPREAHPTPTLVRLKAFRSINPLYGVFLVNQLGAADRNELLQALDSVLDLPGSIARLVRVPPPNELPPGALATSRLDEQLLRLGLVTVEDLTGVSPDEDDERAWDHQPRKWPLTLADKLRLLFDYDFPGVDDVRTRPVWLSAELLRYGGDFNKFVASRRLHKQEGIVFRHLLRLILLLGEFAQLCPPETSETAWRDELGELRRLVTESCARIDPTSTQRTLAEAAALDAAEMV
jgi:superfamily II DNA/RNA helicase